MKPFLIAPFPYRYAIHLLKPFFAVSTSSLRKCPLSMQTSFSWVFWNHSLRRGRTYEMEKLLDVDISTGVPIIIAMLTLILVFSQSNQKLLSLEIHPFPSWRRGWIPYYWSRIENEEEGTPYMPDTWRKSGQLVCRNWCREFIQLKLAATIKGCLDNQIIGTSPNAVHPWWSSH